VLEVDRARILREYELEGVDEITNPTWSPDGSTIVFSGMSGGTSDLWALELASGRSRRLTSDAYADLHPAFSPDGRTLAFVTDRGPGTDLQALRYGNYRVALMDFPGGEIRALAGMERGKNINPQWTADGTGFFFVSDRTGISNVYRYALAGGAVSQVTNLFTGVSGITPLSPTITAAARADRLVFTAFERNVYNIYSLAGAELAGTTPEAPQLAQSGDPLPAVLPPSPRPAEPAYNRVLGLIRDPSYGLPEPSAQATYTTAPYRARLSLDYLGQPSVGVSGTTGPYARGGVYGGVGAIFSDMLGHHTVYGQVQAQGQIDEIGFNVVYLNRKKRWNWGAAAQRAPYLAGGRQTVVDESNVLHDQLLIFRYFDNSIYGIAQYPFSRVQRVELAGGVRRITQDIQIREYLYQVVETPQGAQVVGPFDYQESKQNLGSFNLAEGSAALVYDNAAFGYTSPFAGQRYRFEAAPTMGDLQFTSLTADYRKYFFMRPVTLAVRGLHYGRYGRDEAAPANIFLGYPSLLRGYSYGSVTDGCLAELGQQNAEGGGQECEVYDELFGSRVAVANVELRVPIIRQMIAGNNLALPPVEAFAFFDAGASWGKLRNDFGDVGQTHLNFEFGAQPGFAERGILSSAGVGARINLFGYLIMEADFVRPLDRPRGWHWQFAFQPGF